MTTLLICGSRNATPAMLDYARRCVDRADELGWTVVCGDAEGVDDAVMHHAHAVGLECVVYGAYGKLRRQTLSCSGELCDGDYLARDRRMVDDAEIVVCVWNGKSRGSKYTYDYAVQSGKVAHLMDFSRQEIS